MNELLNAWPLVLFLAIGIGIGRYIERRRGKAAQARAAAAAKEFGDAAVRAGDDVPWIKKP